MKSKYNFDTVVVNYEGPPDKHYENLKKYFNENLNPNRKNVLFCHSYGGFYSLKLSKDFQFYKVINVSPFLMNPPSSIAHIVLTIAGPQGRARATRGASKRFATKLLFFVYYFTPFYFLFKAYRAEYQELSDSLLTAVWENANIKTINNVEGPAESRPPGELRSLDLKAYDLARVLLILAKKREFWSNRMIYDGWNENTRKEADIAHEFVMYPGQNQVVAKESLKGEFVSK